MTELLTARSARVKDARRLVQREVRADRREFLAEGPNAVREALAVPSCVTEVFATPDAMARHTDIAAESQRGDVVTSRCTAAAIDALSGSRSPQGVVAVCRYVDVPLTAALPQSARLAVVAAHVRDPGNAGSLLRCADAVAADAVLLAGSSADLYNDKVVRASAGSLFHLPVVTGMTVSAAVAALREQQFTVLAADGGAPSTLDEMLDSGELAGRVAWVFGNEAWGIPADELTLADRVVAVPIYGRAESLNVATAAAVCLYATARAQRATAR